MSRAKAQALLDLAGQRKIARRDGYDCVGDFHGGVFECDHVSPWTKSGHNVDAAVMVVGQDWSSRDVLARDPPDPFVVEHGFDPSFPTNANLDDLLKQHFGLKRSKCYLTNLFAFIKTGSASAAIPMADLVWSAQRFTLKEIEIVSPRLVACLGLRTFQALQRAAAHNKSPNMEQAASSPFKFANSMIHCVAHTGTLGIRNRQRSQVENDWRKLAESYPGGQHR